jgi:hypothetical protein
LKSHLTNNFLECFRRLPNHIKRSARHSYQLWKNDANHPSLQFKKVGRKHEAYSVRVGIGWRALGVRDKDVIIWFWIGSHPDYERLIKQF